MALLTDLAKLGSDVQWAIFATVNSPEEMVVSVRVTNGEIKSKQNAKIGALNFKGTPGELDEMLAAQLATHVPKARDFFTNCKEFNATVEEAEKQLQEKKTKQPQATQTQGSKVEHVSTSTDGTKHFKKKDPKTIKFETAMSVVEDLEKEAKYGQALAKLPSIKEYPQFKDQIEAKYKHLKSKHVGYDLFNRPDAVTDQATEKPAGELPSSPTPPEPGPFEEAGEELAELAAGDPQE